MTIGGLGASGYMPMRAITSAKFSPAALTSTTTWSPLATGSGRSSTRSTEGSPCPVVTTARMTAMLDVSGQQRRIRLLGAPLPERAGQQRARQEHREDARDERSDADPDRRPDPEQARRVVVGDEPVVVHGLDEQGEEQQPADDRRHHPGQGGPQAA